jgi:hypothetical protein
MNFGPSAAQSEAQVSLIDEFIRRAARELELEAAWVALRGSEDIALINDQAVYDIPDGFDVGRIDGVCVVDSEGREIEMEPGVRSYEREQWSTAAASLPVRFEFQNQTLILYPAPDTERYPTLRIYGYRRAVVPVQAGDRIELDREALVQKATAIGKKHFSMPDAAIADTDCRIYLARIKPMQADGESIHIGGHFSRKFTNTTRRTTRNPDARFFYTNWTPRP